MEDFGRIRMFCFLILGSFISNAQELQPFNEIESTLFRQPKPVVIKIYTDWCGVCAIQDRKIREDDELANLLNTRFYYLELNAESKEPVFLKGNKYEFNPEAKVHELAVALAGEEHANAYPAWVILNSDLEIIFLYNGLIKTNDLKRILNQIP